MITFHASVTHNIERQGAAVHVRLADHIKWAFVCLRRRTRDAIDDLPLGIRMGKYCNCVRRCNAVCEYTLCMEYFGTVCKRSVHGVHISMLDRSCTYHAQAIRRIRRLLSVNRI